MSKDETQNKGKSGLFGIFNKGKDEPDDDQRPDDNADTEDSGNVTPMQQVKSPTLDKIYSLSKGSGHDEPFNASYLYEVSNEIKWFYKEDFMTDMNLKDTYGLEKDCQKQTEEIKNDIIRAKMSDSSDVEASGDWIRQQINNAIFINVNVDKIADIETANYAKGTWIYRSKSSDRGDLSQMRMVTNSEMYDALQRYFNNFIAFF